MMYVKFKFGEMSNVFVLIIIVKCVRNKPAFFAERLYKSMKVIYLFIS